MNATLRGMCERFGPGYWVLDARFTCVDVEDNEGFSDGRNGCRCTDRATAPAPTSTGLALARSPRCAQVHRPFFDHPVPGQPRAGARRRRRRKPTLWRRLKEFRVRRTSLLAAATSVVLSLLLAVVFPQSRSSTFDASRNIVVASSSGTYSPGLSSASVYLENMGLAPSSRLIMELGGTTPASQYDIINGTTTGNFSNLTLAPLPSGLSWDTSVLYSNGEIGVVPEPSTLALLGVGALSLLAYAWRRRRS